MSTMPPTTSAKSLAKLHPEISKEPDGFKMKDRSPVTSKFGRNSLV